MRVCYFYTKLWDKAVAALPPDAEHVYTGGRFTDYWDAICARWGQDDLMFVEHDNVIRDDVTEAFENCPNQWCVFPYWGGGGWAQEGLGCTRFRKEVQLLISTEQIMDDYAGACWECEAPTEELRQIAGTATKGCWRHIDGQIFRTFFSAGIRICTHLPPIEHLTRPLPEGVEYELPDWHQH